MVDNTGLGVKGIKMHEIEDEMFDRMMRENPPILLIPTMFGSYFTKIDLL